MKTNLFFIALILLGLLTPIGAQTANEDHSTYYINGMKYSDNEDYAQAFKLFKQGAEMGYADAMNALGSCYSEGEGVAEDFTQAVYWYRKAAEKGYALAMSNLGCCYYEGEGVAKDLKQAVNWFRKAADLDNDRAMLNLGICYSEGEGVEKDLSEAVNWYRKAADLGNYDAMLNLGICYSEGEGVLKNLKQAVSWYRKAADLGSGGAMDSLGDCYYEGEGVEKDYNQAVSWYRKAADLDNDYAMNSLGDCYYEGKGVEKDYNQAVSWYRKAADLDNDDAMYNLGHCYHYGQGVAQNMQEAKRWLKKASELGNENAKQELAQISVSQNAKSFTVNGKTFKMIRVDGGTFTMGSPDGEGYEDGRDKPAHKVTLTTYYISETEVSKDLWYAVMGTLPWGWDQDDKIRYANSITYEKCQEFLRKLNRMTGQRFRLPTEAEWEFAARGGNYSCGYKYAGSNEVKKRSSDWYEGSPNEIGLYQMSGYTWEWCSDWYGPYSSAAQTNPKGASKSMNKETFHVVRGGHVHSDGERYSDYYYDNCPVWMRTYSSYTAGIRLAL